MSSKPIHDSEGQLEIGQSAPDFSLPGTDGKVHCLNDYRGKVKALVVAFWCNHCPHVIKNEARMIALCKDFEDKGVEFILISANDAVNYPQDSFDNMKKRVKEKGYPCTYLHNEDQQVAKAYGAKVTPHIFAFDSDLKLQYRGALNANTDRADVDAEEYLRQALNSILEDREQQHPKTNAVGCGIKWKM